MSDKYLTKQIYKTNVSNFKTSHRCPRRVYHNQINNVLKRGQIQNTRKSLFSYEKNKMSEKRKAREKCKDRNKKRALLSVYPSQRGQA